MEEAWKFRLTLERIGDQYRAGLLKYRELPDVREEVSRIYMAGSKDEAIAIAERAVYESGQSKYELVDKTKG